MAEPCPEVLASELVSTAPRQHHLHHAVRQCGLHHVWMVRQLQPTHKPVLHRPLCLPACLSAGCCTVLSACLPASLLTVTPSSLPASLSADCERYSSQTTHQPIYPVSAKADQTLPPHSTHWVIVSKTSNQLRSSVSARPSRVAVACIARNLRSNHNRTNQAQHSRHSEPSVQTDWNRKSANQNSNHSSKG